MASTSPAKWILGAVAVAGGFVLWKKVFVGGFALDGGFSFVNDPQGQTVLIWKGNITNHTQQDIPTAAATLAIVDAKTGRTITAHGSSAPFSIHAGESVPLALTLDVPNGVGRFKGVMAVDSFAAGSGRPSVALAVKEKDLAIA